MKRHPGVGHRVLLLAAVRDQFLTMMVFSIRFSMQLAIDVI